jgi:hypothetical protein
MSASSNSPIRSSIPLPGSDFRNGRSQPADSDDISGWRGRLGLKREFGTRSDSHMRSENVGESAMPRIVIATALLAGWIALCSARPAQAQQRFPAPRALVVLPGNPAPLGLGQRQRVAQHQLQRMLTEQSAQIRRQQGSIRSLESRFTQFQQGGPVAPTGRRTSFGRLSPYYGRLSPYYGKLRLTAPSPTAPSPDP